MGGWKPKHQPISTTDCFLWSLQRGLFLDIGRTLGSPQSCTLARGWGGHRVPQDLFQLSDEERSFPGIRSSEFLDSEGMAEGWQGLPSLVPCGWS